MKSLKDLKQEAFASMSGPKKQEFDITSGYTDAYIDRGSDLITIMLEKDPILSGLEWSQGHKANNVVQLNILEIEPYWSNTDCWTGTSSDISIAPRTVTMKRISNRGTICLDELDRVLPMLNKPGAFNDALTFEGRLTELNLRKNAEWSLRGLFRGDTSAGTGNWGKVDGLIKLALSETGSLAGYSTASTGMTAGNALSRMDTIIGSQSARMLDKRDVYAYMSLTNFQVLQSAYFTAYPNNISGTGVYLNGAYIDQIDHNAFRYKGTNVIIKGTDGMYGTDDILILPYSDIRGLTDQKMDMDQAYTEYNTYHKSWFTDVVFTLGFTYIDPGSVILFHKV